MTPIRASVEQKLMIIEYYRLHNMSQAAVVNHFKDSFRISTSTFSDWLKEEDVLRKRASGNVNKKATLAEVNASMDSFVQKLIASNQPVNESILLDHWRETVKTRRLGSKHHLKGFSKQWFEKFKQKHKLGEEAFPVEFRFEDLAYSPEKTGRESISPEPHSVASTFGSSHDVLEGSRFPNIQTELSNEDIRSDFREGATKFINYTADFKEKKLYPMMGMPRRKSSLAPERKLSSEFLQTEFQENFSAESGNFSSPLKFLRFKPKTLGSRLKKLDREANILRRRTNLRNRLRVSQSRQQLLHHHKKRSLRKARFLNLFLVKAHHVLPSPRTCNRTHSFLESYLTLWE